MSEITNMSDLVVKTDDVKLKGMLELILGEVQLRFNISRLDALVKVKKLAYKTLPFRKSTIDAAFQELESANV